MSRPAPLLHRDDPDKSPLVGHVKVTREDWLNIARDVLVHHGVAEVKILTLSDRLQVSRSSFYWYFQNRADLLAALLDEWEARNTATLTAYCARPANSITEALCNFFRCFVDPALFDTGLDFAVREWSRRDATLGTRVHAADAVRLKAVTGMFARFGYPPAEADARARILYFMQLGYHALEVREPMDIRMGRVGPYVQGFTGRPLDEGALADFMQFVEGLGLD
ncbi:TetR/AcrR family transcriptional regulator [uncultured Tateyamaria sp.]|uniref:TetR/AcrR family transcriptional regulator n=1 Tax=Tateyamaria sp. TaxID=1929288 RepID=UPI002633DB61|nr:TetR/AcrR family transcriptional regulator [uncultured Tateyamaria sp.]